MPKIAIAHQRLHQQGLSHHPFNRAENVVSWLGAVQAQDYNAAKWALGLRLPAATDDDIEQAFNQGRILRTHVMRPTWHFVTPEDIRWMLELTAPRVNAFAAYYYRKLELDDALFQRCQDIIIRELAGGQQRTREELTAAVEQAGVMTSELRMTHILMWAELAAVICSGARRGKQQTYALLEERAPQAKSPPRPEALAELARRYFSGHGPAQLQDFVWWSGLTVADAKTGVELARSQLACEEIDGQAYWFAPDQAAVQPDSAVAYLLPNYDEYTVGYSDRSAVHKGDPPNHLDPRGAVLLNYIIVFDGQVIGAWRRTFRKNRVIIELKPFEPFTAAQDQAVHKAAQRYGEYLGLDVELGVN